MADLTFMNHGSIFTMTALTEAGDAWIAEHIPADAMTWGGSVVIEPRYVADIVAGARADGLAVGI